MKLLRRTLLSIEFDDSMAVFCRLRREKNTIRVYTYVANRYEKITEKFLLLPRRDLFTCSLITYKKQFLKGTHLIILTSESIDRRYRWMQSQALGYSLIEIFHLVESFVGPAIFVDRLINVFPC